MVRPPLRDFRHRSFEAKQAGSSAYMYSSLSPQVVLAAREVTVRARGEMKAISSHRATTAQAAAGSETSRIMAALLANTASEATRVEPGRC